MSGPSGTKPHWRRWRIAVLLRQTDDLLACNWRDQRTGRLGRAVLLVSFALVTLAGNDAVGEAFTVWAYRHSAMVLGTLVLLIYCVTLFIDQLRQEQFSVRRSRFSSAPLRAASPGTRSL